MNFIEAHDIDGTYDLVIVGTGFGSLFFGLEALRHLPKNARVLLLERGGYLNHNEQIGRSAHSVDPDDHTKSLNAAHCYRATRGHKPWNFSIDLGGGTLCWWGQTPWLHPADFQLKLLYGVGQEWPISYDDLEPFYCDAEQVIRISGDSENAGPFARSRPYQMPPFLPSDADQGTADTECDRPYRFPRRATASRTVRAHSAAPSANAACARTTPSSLP